MYRNKSPVNKVIDRLILNVLVVVIASRILRLPFSLAPTANTLASVVDTLGDVSLLSLQG
ncbi:hypothetical protein [Psychrobacillus sp. NPDC096623]|uniref:hypothetical protein n=1 Tax=Psychrobacillus sp. NPDC096623 TaxID=3364492 RepID=UPI003809B499